MEEKRNNSAGSSEKVTACVSGCPVHKADTSGTALSAPASSSNPQPLAVCKTGTCPIPHNNSTNSSNSSSESLASPPPSCPVHGKVSSSSPLIQKMTGEAKYNEAANDFTFSSSQRQEGQRFSLSVSREESTIPKSDYTPQHQPSDGDNWVYPSGSMQRRKTRK